MQLVAFGVQDQYLVGNPTITYFKLVHKRHTNFACESILQTATGQATDSGRQTFTISRNGDLLTKAVLQFKFPANGDPTANDDVSTLVSKVELEIGGQTIDTLPAEWLKAWNDLTIDASKRDSTGYVVAHKLAAATAGFKFLELPFFFSKSPGLALPLIALQYHEVKIVVTYGALHKATPSLYCTYAFLDSEERRRFAAQSHEYLIEQVQHQEHTLQGTSGNVRLVFNHPTKELIVTGACDDAGGFTSVWDSDPDEAMLLKLNGNDRESARPASYYERMVPLMYHTRVPTGIACMPFALYPEQHQPSGTCNFSRIDNAELHLKSTATNSKVHVFALNYNVLKIVSGMGGLAYSN